VIGALLSLLVYILGLSYAVYKFLAIVNREAQIATFEKINDLDASFKWGQKDGF